MGAMKSEQVFTNIKQLLKCASDSQKEAYQKYNAVCLIELTDAEGNKQLWLLTLKDKLEAEQIEKEKADGIKADARITMKDADFYDLSCGNLAGQKAFMTGKMKIKGNLMLVTKLEKFLQSSMKAKL